MRTAADDGGSRKAIGAFKGRCETYSQRRILDNEYTLIKKYVASVYSKAEN